MSLLSPSLSAAQTAEHAPPTPTRELVKIALPVSLEFVAQLALGLVDQIIVALLGTLAVAGVGFANSVTLILFFTLNAIGAGTSILVARAHGAGDKSGASRLFGAALVLGVVVSGVLAVPLILGGAGFLRSIGATPEVAGAGGPFLSVVAISLPLVTAAAIFSGALRSTGHARTPMTITIVAVILNTVLGYALVTGFGPFPKLGVVGVGIATTASYALRAGLLAWQTYGRGILDATLPRTLANWKSVLAPLIPLSLPMAATELAWSGGTFLYALLAGRISTNTLAAMQISNTLEGVFIVASLGLGSAATVLIGQSLGRGSAAGAQAWAHKIRRSGLVVALGAGALFALTATLLGVLFPQVDADVRHIALISILVNAAFQIIKVQNILLGIGILPGANDPRGVLIGDAVAAFVVGLPLAYLLAFPLGLGFWGLLIARGLEETAKMLIFIWRARKIKWEQHIYTGEGEAPITAGH
ncbi:MATE family efflux transporter [Deinococcus psychrotolerans]|uniref:MATE family efflux transporter n=1 Tax=Deinococcus psychrotolerans TaxID=2489213 RepID=UPI001F1508ED|nr:MATE family efflux transporter [Deinococcus psychrotolerans]